MTTTLGRGTKKKLFSLTTAAAILGAVLLVAAPTPASAKDNGRGHGHGKGHGKGHAAKVVHYRVPQVITVEHRGQFKPYFAGRTFYAPHRHYHARYKLPVWVNGVVVHRPYAYCEDHLFVTSAVSLPQLAIGFTYAKPGGVAISGFYGSPAPYAPPVYYEPRHRYDDHRGCDHY